MRHILKTALLCAALLCALSLQAQTSKTQRQKPSKTEMAQKQASRIADELSLADETRDRFIATFVNCQQEIWASRGRKCGKITSDTQADSLIRARFDQSQRALDLRRRYYDEYRKFLTPRQINRVYELERDMMKHLGDGKRATGSGAKAAKREPGRKQAGS